MCILYYINTIVVEYKVMTIAINGKFDIFLAKVKIVNNISKPYHVYCGSFPNQPLTANGQDRISFQEKYHRMPLLNQFIIRNYLSYHKVAQFLTI